MQLALLTTSSCPFSSPAAIVPNPVLGGVTTFLFASVCVSGLRVIALAPFTRRDRFVLAAALSFGVADLLQPELFTHLFDGKASGDGVTSGLKGFEDSIVIILSTPCECIFSSHILPDFHWG